MKQRMIGVVLVGAVACTSTPSAGPSTPVAAAPAASRAAPLAERVPTVRLPSDTRPTAEAIELHIDPSQARFSGSVELAITLDHPRHMIWLHGQKLHVTRVVATAGHGAPLVGSWQDRDPRGLASITLPSELPAGPAVLHIEFDAAFNTGDAGLYKLTQAGAPYAFTQFESIDARDAFPCFDEPGFKIPYDVTLVVPDGLAAIANSHELSRTAEGTQQRIHFAPTLPLPSYLVAFAVGPLDVVAAPDMPPNAIRTRPVPLRGVATRGNGKRMAFALAHTGEIIALLEQYTGIEYPYDKLDLIAVPDKPGAMENAGAVTFEDSLLFLDGPSSLGLRRGYAGVVAHELAHQWTGDLVTMAWWDDVWLNEAFASWIESKISEQWDPTLHQALARLDQLQPAMNSDALVSARQIRQPIESTDDIADAFDSITYQKGAAVLAMFERWVGEDAYQRGLHDYLTKHRFGNATADDFLDAESAAAGKDVKTPFHTFLDQPGQPFIEAELRCQGAPSLHLKQSRFLPIGSAGDAARTWQVPVCARYATGKTSHEACTLLTQAEGDLALGDTCPDWVMPNAAAAGYFRFALAPADLDKLTRRGLASLTPSERTAYGTSLRAAYLRASTSFGELLAAAQKLVNEPRASLASQAITMLEDAHDWTTGPAQAAVERRGRELYGAVGRQLGWNAGKTDSSDRIELRRVVQGFLSDKARDPATRAEAKRRGLAYLGNGERVHAEAVNADLVGIAMVTAGEDADRALWDRVRALFGKTEDSEVRDYLLLFLSANQRPEIAPAVLELAFDPTLRPNEIFTPIVLQMDGPATRDATWTWLKAHYDRLLALLAAGHRQPVLLRIGMRVGTCTEDHLRDLEQFFGPRIDKVENGRRTYAQLLERQQLCVARRKAHEPSLRALFTK